MVSGKRGIAGDLACVGGGGGGGGRVGGGGGVGGVAGGEERSSRETVYRERCE